MRVFEAENMFPGFAFDPGSLITGGLGLAGSLIGGSASSDAASAQRASDAAAIAEQRREFDLVRQTEAPFVNVGQGGIGALGWLLGIGSPTANIAGSGSSGAGTTGAGTGQTNRYEVINQNRLSEPDTPLTGIHLSSDGTQVLDNRGNPLSPNQIQNLISDHILSQGTVGNGTGTGGGAGAGGSATGGSGGYGGYGSFGSLTQPFSLADFHEDPGYEFALTEGQRALQRTQAANGQLQSGAAAKAMETYSQGVADQQYGAAFDRYNTNQTNLYNRLMGVSQLGQAAASNQTSAGSNMANNVSSLLQDQGNASAAGALGQGAAWQTGLSSLGNTFGGMFNSSPPVNVGTQSGFNYGPITWN